MKRPSRIAHYAKLARMVALRGSCRRRKVGAVVTDKKGFILATGYNGRAVAGIPDCTDEGCGCKGSEAKSGEDLQHCAARHAEISLISQIADVSKMYDLYITTSPCVECTKILLGTGVKNIYYWEGYIDRRKAWYYWKTYRPEGKWQCLTNGNATKNLDVQTRFDLQWQEDPMTECWEWQAGCNGGGYGAFHGFGGGNNLMGAHRAAYIIYKDKDPGDLMVCHSCDNPKCVNPDHLFLGTNSDNIRDARVKNKFGTITTEEITEMRRLWESGEVESRKELAKIFPIGLPQIGRILNYKVSGYIK